MLNHNTDLLLTLPQLMRTINDCGSSVIVAYGVLGTNSLPSNKTNGNNRNPSKSYYLLLFCSSWSTYSTKGNSGCNVGLSFIFQHVIDDKYSASKRHRAASTWDNENGAC